MSVFKTARNSIKTTLNIAASNGMIFSVQVVPLADKEGEFPEDSDVFEQIEEYVKKTMQYKELNPRALEGMKRKWAATHGSDVPFVPKKQPSEMLVVLIAPSKEQIHLFYSVPKTMTFSVPDAHYEDKWDFGNRDIYFGPIAPPADSTLFKYPDQLAREILGQLKIQGIYCDDDSDDEMYCLNDLEDA